MSLEERYASRERSERNASAGRETETRATRGKPTASPEGLKPPSPPADAFVTLMLLSVAALAIGVGLLAMTLADYGWAVKATP